jgi:hypothetical protein
MGKTEDLSNCLSIGQIFCVHNRGHSNQDYTCWHSRSLMLAYGCNHVNAPAVRKHPGAWPEPTRRSDMAQPIAAIALDDLDHRITLTIEETASLLGLGRT